MLWEINKNIPEIGDMRHRSAFILFPKKIGNIVRWLECTMDRKSG